MLEADLRGRRGWVRAVGLIIASGGLSVLNPGLLVAFPFALLVIFLPSPRSMALLTGIVVAGLALMVQPFSGLWYMERGWALLLGGWFLALTLRKPDQRFLPRGLGAVAGSFLAMALIFWSRPGAWPVADGAVTSRIESGMAFFVQAVQFSLGPEAVPEVQASGFEAVALQSLIFPALLGLASLSSLGVAWWLYLRLVRADASGIGPFRDLRFHDHLVWVFILGLLMVLGSTGFLDRIGLDLGRVGTNAVVFMGALYALRGAAVVLFLMGGVSVFGGILLLLGFFFLAPLFVAGAFVMGLGDTWLDLRARAAAASSPRV
jgi:hypothetical protein